jgi:hypothetical protein
VTPEKIYCTDIILRNLHVGDSDMPASVEMSLTATQATSIPSGVRFGEDERVRVVLKVGRTAAKLKDVRQVED